MTKDHKTIETHGMDMKFLFWFIGTNDLRSSCSTMMVNANSCFTETHWHIYLQILIILAHLICNNKCNIVLQVLRKLDIELIYRFKIFHNGSFSLISKPCRSTRLEIFTPKLDIYNKIWLMTKPNHVTVLPCFCLYA